MNRGFFPILIFLMTLSLIGIILIQRSWINKNESNFERQFVLSVSAAISEVSSQIKERELLDYLSAYQKMIDSIGTPRYSELTEVFEYIDRSPDADVSYFIQQGIIEDDYNISLQTFDSLSNDSAPILDYRRIKSLTIIDESFEREKENMSSTERLQRIERMSSMDKARYETIFMDFADTKPIQMRINNLELELLLRQEFLLREIRIPFEFRVFEGNQATVVGSENYLSTLNERQYKTPLFIRDDESHRYELRIAFPNLDRFIEESVYNTLLLSLLFTLIILGVFAASLFQILKQKKISEIKSDFINNMTHEFKTPIATIHLALDALNNKGVLKDSKKFTGYLEMIRDENKRLHTHVENVLQISQLEKRELDLEKQNIDPHLTIQSALDHVRLIIQNRGGQLIQQFSKDPVQLFISSVHMTNVWVNLLDNAIKYSNEKLVVEIKTNVDEKGFTVKIKDKGIGMTAAVRKRIFDKFYRESSGNIHNVKGHGLGLAYVKQIIKMHSGTISVSSAPNQGSTFTVFLPF